MVEMNSSSKLNRIEVTNNASKYYSDLASKFANQAREYADLAKTTESDISLLLQNADIDTVKENMDSIKEVAQNIDVIGLGNAEWGKVSGDIFAQVDLKSVLDLKVNGTDLAPVAVTGNYNDLVNVPTLVTVPTNISEFINDVGYLTEIPENYTTSDDVYTKIEIDSQLGSISTLLDKINGEVV